MRKTVLFVDDDEEMRNTIAEFLSKKYDVMTASDGATALERFRERRPDLVITDVMLPGGSGLNFAKAMRDANVPIIVVSGIDTTALLVASAMGVNTTLEKPFEIDDLAKKIKSLIG